MQEAISVVGIGGSTRAGSTAEKALRIALRAAERRGARTTLFSGPDLDLPLYDPARATASPAACALVAAISRADGLIISTPAYHAAPSGMVKNALDYVEELRTDRRPYLSDRAVGCISVCSGWQASVAAVSSLRAIVHALRGWPTPLGVTINTEVTAFDAAGQVSDPQTDERLALVAEQVVEFALMRRALPSGSGGPAGPDAADSVLVPAQPLGDIRA